MMKSCIDGIEKGDIAELNTRLERRAINSPHPVRREKDIIESPNQVRDKQGSEVDDKVTQKDVNTDVNKASCITRISIV